MFVFYRTMLKPKKRISNRRDRVLFFYIIGIAKAASGEFSKTVVYDPIICPL